MERSTETPMDFQWQTQAPADQSSPFVQFTRQHSNQQKKRPHSIFDSPNKPSTPALRDPSSQTFLFTQPRNQPSAFQPSSAFTTPRKFDLDFSSGAENVSSPDNADNEDTPEQPANRRNSLFNLYGRFAPSPGRGEIPRTNKFSNVLVNRVKKRRRRDKGLERHLQRAGDESSRPSSSEGPPPQQQNQSQQPSTASHEIPFFSRLFTFLETHPHIPRILSYYAQFTFNLILAFLTLYVIVTFLLAIQYDVRRASDEVSADILAEMAACAKNYVENRCSGEDGRRLPALEAVCSNWERCMNRDPAKVGRAKVSAQTLAEIFNGFIEPISFKTMFFFVASITSCVAVSNLTFSFFRNKSNNPPYMAYPPPQHQPQHPQIPYTPGHPGFGMGAPYYEATPGYNGNFNMSPRKTSRPHDEEPQKQIMQSQYGDHDIPRTPSPVKRSKIFT